MFGLSHDNKVWSQAEQNLTCMRVTYLFLEPQVWRILQFDDSVDNMAMIQYSKYISIKHLQNL